MREHINRQKFKNSLGLAFQLTMSDEKYYFETVEKILKTAKKILKESLF